MSRLTKEQLLKDKQTHDPNSITSLSLDHKALSDVSSLAEFKNLERLDLAFNNLTALQGLKSCINLKWLSVVQNKLQTLKGIEGLTKLTVLNAGKNKLRSMEEVKSLVNLRALILNDNEIVSICGLDEMKDLNTLVLSRNPISKIGDSLVKLKSITKLSASNCQIQAIDSSVKCCIELKELRLAHNDIKSLPAELCYNKKLQNLDLGNNLISRWSELKALDSLVNLKNLNLQGNPIAENDKLAKKVNRLLPNLHIFNARPIDKSIKSKMGKIVDIASHDSAYKEETDDEEIKNQKKKKKKNPQFQGSVQKQDLNRDNATGLDVDKELKGKRKKGNGKPSTEVQVDDEEDVIDEKEKKKKKSKEGEENMSNPVVEEKIIKKQRKTKDKLLRKEASKHYDGTMVEEKSKDKKLEIRDELDIIDDGGTSFTELFTHVAAPKDDVKRKIVDRAGHDTELADSLVTYPAKKKKSKRAVLPELRLSPAVEVGIGGASTWDD